MECCEILPGAMDTNDNNYHIRTKPHSFGSSDLTGLYNGLSSLMECEFFSFELLYDLKYLR